MFLFSYCLIFPSKFGNKKVFSFASGIPRTKASDLPRCLDREIHQNLCERVFVRVTELALAIHMALKYAT